MLKLNRVSPLLVVTSLATFAVADPGVKTAEKPTVGTPIVVQSATSFGAGNALTDDVAEMVGAKSSVASGGGTPAPTVPKEAPLPSFASGSGKGGNGVGSASAGVVGSAGNRTTVGAAEQASRSEVATQATVPPGAAVVAGGNGDVATAGAVSPARGVLNSSADAAARPAISMESVKEKAKALLAQMRGDSGEAPPPGTAIYASPLGFGGAVAAAALPGAVAAPAAANAAGAGYALRGFRSGGVRGAETKFGLRDYPGAERDLSKVLAADPKDAAAWRLRALTRRRMRAFQPSLEDAQQALGLRPTDSLSERVLIDELVDLHRSGDAIAAATRWLKSAPRDAGVLASRANAHMSRGERGEQLADLREAASYDADFKRLYEDEANGGGRGDVHPRPNVVWLGAIGTALLFFSFVLYRRRGDTTQRTAMRLEDHHTISGPVAPPLVPAGFRIVRTLGQGGMGVVYEAVDLGLQRTVALKKLRAEVAENPRERARFLKEARLVAALRHPNIVSIHSIHEDGDGLFLVFERVPGGTLYDKLEGKPLPPAEAVGWLKQIADALDYAHSQGIVHKDLKPSNVMLDGGIAKVMDFGIARRVADALSTMSSVEVIGTPAYMAPEQEMSAAVGAPADVFALGASAYELLVGRPPFPRGGLMMKSEKLYRPVREQIPSYPPAVDDAIARALEPDPKKRWPTARAFVDALARAWA